jgi:GNAT superfamily N-acetyltransferase
MSGVTVRRARIEEIRPLAGEYVGEQRERHGERFDPALPQGGVFWIAEEATGEPLGYAAGTLRAEGCTIGPVYTRANARRRGVGDALLSAIQAWAEETRVPVVEISVEADNLSGRAFLEALGYRPRRVLMSLRPSASDARTG